MFENCSLHFAQLKQVVKALLWLSLHSYFLSRTAYHSVVTPKASALIGSGRQKPILDRPLDYPYYSLGATAAEVVNVHDPLRVFAIRRAVVQPPRLNRFRQQLLQS